MSSLLQFRLVGNSGQSHCLCLALGFVLELECDAARQTLGRFPHGSPAWKRQQARCAAPRAGGLACHTGGLAGCGCSVPRLPWVIMQDMDTSPRPSSCANQQGTPVPGALVRCTMTTPCRAVTSRSAPEDPSRCFNRVPGHFPNPWCISPSPRAGHLWAALS